jgi:hypothetical protein
MYPVRLIIIILVVLSFFLLCASSFAVKEDFDPHFTGDYCDVCHEQIPQKDGEKYLKYGGDYVQLCKCHNYTPGTYIHPVFIKPSEEKLASIPADFPLDKGEITCKTCHDMYEQCQANPRLRIRAKHHRIERMFLRGGTFSTRTEICFKCHDESKYKMLDPHNQLTVEGEIVTEKCLYCHKDKPDLNTSSYRDIQLIGNLRVLCQRCHGLLNKHPANVNHFVPPSNEVYIRMSILKLKYKIVLPLDDEGKITCITCHNPHERGVIPVERAGAKGAGEYFRHRLPGIMCKSCHGK